MAKRTIENMYPDRRAREIADEVTEGMSLDDTMLQYIVAWEEAYLGAGGRVRL